MTFSIAQFDNIVGVTPRTASASEFKVVATPKEFIPAASYFLIHSPTVDYAVWFDTTGSTTAPTIAGSPTLLKCNISGIAANAGPGPVASIIQSVVNGAAAFTATVIREEVTIVNVVDGTTQVPADVNSGCFVSLNVYNEGGIYGHGDDERFVIPISSMPTDTDVDGTTGTPLSPHVDYWQYLMDTASGVAGFTVDEKYGVVAAVTIADDNGTPSVLVVGDTTLLAGLAGLTSAYIPV